MTTLAPSFLIGSSLFLKVTIEDNYTISNGFEFKKNLTMGYMRS